MNNRSCLFVCILASIAVLLSALNLVLNLSRNSDVHQNLHYELCLGLNDKESNLPVASLEEARTKLEPILISRFGGYAVQEARGGWIDEKGTVFREDSLVISLDDTTLDEVKALSDELLRVFNQSSILIRKSKVQTEYYSGK